MQRAVPHRKHGGRSWKRKWRTRKKENVFCPSQVPVPPPSPVHRRSPVPLAAVQDVDDTVSETADSSLVIRMTSRQEGEEVLTVEVTRGEGEEQTEKKTGEE